jgi:hypothetical protein
MHWRLFLFGIVGPVQRAQYFEGVFGHKSERFLLFHFTGIWGFQNYMYEDLDDHRFDDNGRIQRTRPSSTPF